MGRWMYTYLMVVGTDDHHFLVYTSVNLFEVHLQPRVELLKENVNMLQHGDRFRGSMLYPLAVHLNVVAAQVVIFDIGKPELPILVVPECGRDDVFQHLAQAGHLVLEWDVHPWAVTELAVVDLAIWVAGEHTMHASLLHELIVWEAFSDQATGK